MLRHTSNAKKGLAVAWLLLFVTYFWPGGTVVETVRFDVFGWPFFALWVVVIGPLLAASIFFANAYLDLRNDHLKGESPSE